MKLLQSFQFALRGLGYILRHERNARVHLAIAVIVVVTALLLRVSSLELVAVCFSIVLVFFAEIVNSAVERVSNLVTQESNDQIRIIKDITAAGVLVCSAAALIIGVVIIARHL